MQGHTSFTKFLSKLAKNVIIRGILGRPPLGQIMGKPSELSLYVTSASGLSVSGLPLARANLYLDPPDHNRSTRTARRFRCRTWRRSTVHGLGTHRFLTEILCITSHTSRGTQSGSSRVYTRVYSDLNGCLLESRGDPALCRYFRGPRCGRCQMQRLPRKRRDVLTVSGRSYRSCALNPRHKRANLTYK